MSRRRKLLLLGLCILAAGLIVWKGLVYRDHLRNVPEAMNLWWVRYAWEESWGFGPGGSYTGIIVYDMPTAVKTELRDRKSTRLNSSHSQISYAVFCLKKKKKKTKRKKI